MGEIIAEIIFRIVFEIIFEGIWYGVKRLWFALTRQKSKAEVAKEVHVEHKIETRSTLEELRQRRAKLKSERANR